MVTHLVHEFIPEALSARLDFSRMERINAKFHARGERREGDVIWRIPTADGPDFYLYILLEFQSTIDWWMVVRVGVYVGLLWQQIIRDTKLKRGALLPPVLPIVLYNGDPRWDAPLAVTDLIALPPDSPLWQWQPRGQYYLLDEGRFPGNELTRRTGLAALLFRLETCSDSAELLRIVDEILAWFRDHPDYQALKRVFTDIVRQTLPNTTGDTLPFPEDMLEIRTMLANKIPGWQQQWKNEGIAEGMRLGEAEGKKLGEAEGKKLGEAEGKKLGEAEGMRLGQAKGKADTLLRLLGHRYGEVPETLRNRVMAADAAQCDAWIDAVFYATPLTEVFGEK
jgi:hypothetical protein